MNVTVSRRKHDITKKFYKRLAFVYNTEENSVSLMFSLCSGDHSFAIQYFDDSGSILYNVRKPNEDPEKVIRHACSADRNLPDENFVAYKSIGKPYFFLKTDEY